MVKVIRYIGIVLYTCVLSNLIRLLFLWLAPWLITLRWFGAMMYWVAAIAVVAVLPMLFFYVTIPLSKMFRNTGGRVLSTGIIFFSAGYNVVIPWGNHPCGTWSIIMSVSIDIFILLYYFLFLGSVWTSNRQRRKVSTSLRREWAERLMKKNAH